MDTVVKLLISTFLFGMEDYRTSRSGIQLKMFGPWCRLDPATVTVDVFYSVIWMCQQLALFQYRSASFSFFSMMVLNKCSRRVRIWRSSDHPMPATQALHSAKNQLFYNASLFIFVSINAKDCLWFFLRGSRPHTLLIIINSLDPTPSTRCCSMQEACLRVSFSFSGCKTDCWGEQAIAKKFSGKELSQIHLLCDSNPGMIVAHF